MNEIELIILSLVADAPRFGDEIEHQIESRGLRQWVTIGYASVYYVLNKLEKDNLLRGELPIDDLRTGKKRYAITNAGRAVLRTNVVDMLTRGRGGLGQFDVALLAASTLSPQMIRDALYQRRVEIARQIEKTHETIDSAQRQKDDDPLNVQGALQERALKLLEYDLEWLTAFEVEWEDYHEIAPKSTNMNSAISPNLNEEMHTPPAPKRIQKIQRPPSD